MQRNCFQKMQFAVMEDATEQYFAEIQNSRPGKGTEASRLIETDLPLELLHASRHFLTIEQLLAL